MSFRHKVCISVGRQNEGTSEIVRSGSYTVRSRLLNLLFGKKVGVFVITPGRTVETVEIRELKKGGE